MPRLSKSKGRLLNIAMELKYRPSDLAYYTTWWLTSRPSNSSQMTTASVQNSIKSDEECMVMQQVIISMVTYFL